MSETHICGQTVAQSQRPPSAGSAPADRQEGRVFWSVCLHKPTCMSLGLLLCLDPGKGSGPFLGPAA